MEDEQEAVEEDEKEEKKEENVGVEDEQYEKAGRCKGMKDSEEIASVGR